GGRKRPCRRASRHRDHPISGLIRALVKFKLMVTVLGKRTVPKPVFNNPAIDPLTQDNQVKILLAAYQKHAAELLAIEASQERLINLILGIYSAGLTLIVAMLKDARVLLQGPDHTLSPLALALIVVAVLIGAYA